MSSLIAKAIGNVSAIGVLELIKSVKIRTVWTCASRHLSVLHSSSSTRRRRGSRQIKSRKLYGKNLQTHEKNNITSPPSRPPTPPTTSKQPKNFIRQLSKSTPSTIPASTAKAPGAPCLTRSRSRFAPPPGDVPGSVVPVELLGRNRKAEVSGCHLGTSQERQ